MPTQRFLTYLSLVFLGFSCGISPGKLKKLPDDINKVQSRQTINIQPGVSKTMSIQYLGSGGMYLLNNKEGILIDPFFSHQKIGKLVSSIFLDKCNIRPDKEMVEYGLKAIEKQTGELSPQLKAIFSAHSHYDHLLDVPAVYKETRRQAMVYLNRSGYNICHKVIDTFKMEVLENYMTTSEAETKPTPIVLKTQTGWVNVYPILAEHNPHFKNLKAFDGDVTSPKKTFNNAYSKTNANDWLEGNTFSFVIDYLNSEGTIELRLFIQSSSCEPRAGFPPRTLPKHKIDIAFLGLSSYEPSEQYPEALIKTLDTSTQIVWIHWEDFFRKYSKEPKTVRATNVPAFFKQKEVESVKSRAYLPWPQAVFEVNY